MHYDVIVVGGGPAGMFAAITAAEQGNSVMLLERNDRLGKKLLITGKGRCNITNNCSARVVLENVPCNGRFLFSAMESFPPDAIINFLENNGCATKTERGNRVFPTSDRSQSVLDCLKRKIHQLKIPVIHDRAQQVLTEGNAVCGIRGTAASYQCDCVILATGGLSYHATGSTGDGYKMAERLGHRIVPQEGSLVPLCIEGDECVQMQGLSLRNVGVKLLDAKGKLQYSDFGELLFTHFGVSGPTVLSASAHMKGEGCKLVIDLKPALEAEKLQERIVKDLTQYRNRSMENALTDLLPRSMIPVVIQRLKISPQMQANSFTKELRKELVYLLKNFTLNIIGKRPVDEAIITRGGIKVSEIDPKTMQSKRICGLYFAGEIIDCDAYTGGFNLQIAWATGYAAGRNAKPGIDKKHTM